jgi:hypothetical protein
MENDISAKTESELTLGVVLEAKGVHQGDLLTALKFCFPCEGHPWAVKFVVNNRFLVHASPKWRDQALSEGYVILGDVSVRVFKADVAFPQGMDPAHVWVKIVDLPVGFCDREVIAYLVHEYATLL